MRASSSARATPIHFDNQGRATHLPLLRARVAGRSTSLLLDSGATTHVIAEWLARDLGLALETSAVDTMLDHQGARVPVLRARGVEVTLETWGALEQTTYLVTPMPSVFEREQVGGLVSPQELARSGGSLLLDLRRGLATLETTREAEAQLASERGCALTAIAPTVCASAALDRADAPLFTVRATVEEREARLLLDTGAIRTDVVAGARLARRARAGDAGEAAFVLSGSSDYRVLPRARVRAGECDFVRNVDLIEGSAGGTCAHEGALGIDVLRSCVLLIDPSRLRAKCDP